MNKDLIINSANQVFVSALSVITTILLANTLSPEVLGQYSYYMYIANFVIVLGSFSMASYGSRMYFKNKPNFYNMITTLQILFAIVSSICFYIISSINNIDATITWALLATIFIRIVDSTWVLTIRGQYLKLFFFSIIPSILRILTIIYIALSFEVTLENIIIINAIFTIMQYGGITFWAMRSFKFKPNIFPNVHNILSEMMPLFLAGVFSMIYTTFDKIILGYVGQNAQLAFYSNATVLLRMFSLIVYAMLTVSTPRLTKARTKINLKYIVEYNYIFAIIISFVTILIIETIASDLVLILFGPNYTEMIIFIQMMAPIFLLFSINQVTSHAMRMTTSENANKWLKITIFAALISVVGNMILIPLYGAYAAIVVLGVVELTVCIISLRKLSENVNIKMILLFATRSVIYIIIICILVQFIESVLIRCSIELLLVGCCLYFEQRVVKNLYIKKIFKGVI